MEHEYTGELKPCPFCNHQPARWNLIDSLYPTGNRWFKSPNLDIFYFGQNLECEYSFNISGSEALEYEITEHGDYWTFSCLETEGGCGCTFEGLSMNDVMQKWNRREQ